MFFRLDFRFLSEKMVIVLFSYNFDNKRVCIYGPHALLGLSYSLFFPFHRYTLCRVACSSYIQPHVHVIVESGFIHFLHLRVRCSNQCRQTSYRPSGHTMSICFKKIDACFPTILGSVSRVSTAIQDRFCNRSRFRCRSLDRNRSRNSTRNRNRTMYLTHFFATEFLILLFQGFWLEIRD